MLFRSQVQPETLHAGDGLGFLEELKALCSHGQVNLAEDRLFEELDFSAPSALITVLGFYEYVNSFSDQQLEAWGYSREEIYQGLADCGERFGVDPRLLGAFLANNSQLTLEALPSVRQNLLTQGCALPRGNPHPGLANEGVHTLGPPRQTVLEAQPI